MLTRGKYIVFQNDVVDKSNLIGRRRLDEKTYFLLRDQDILSTMTLRSYASNALQVLDWGRHPATGEPLTEEEKDELSRRADGAQMLADEWAKKEHKIPD